VGTIWFSDSAAEEKMIEYMNTLELSQDIDNEDNDALRILDLGTGNGHLLFALREDGWAAELVGVDYSEKSVRLAQQIHQKQLEEVEGVENEDNKDDGDNMSVRDNRLGKWSPGTLSFEQYDILQDTPGLWLKHGFDIVLDKGTFDAISLSDDKDPQTGRRTFEGYGRKVAALVRQGGYLLVTSCNWTEDELRKWFESDVLHFHQSIKFPSYTFGGVKGQTVSSICFKRKQ